MVKLSDICTKASSNIRQNDIGSRNGPYPIYGASGLIQTVDFYEQKTPYVAIVKDGAGAGRVMCLPAFSSVIGTVQYILPNTGVNARYLAYAMEALDLSRYCKGATIPHIYFKDYCVETLPSHTEAEQVRIADVLEKIDACISLRARQLEKLDELVQAQFVEMFGDPVTNEKGWTLVPLSALANIRIGPFGSLLHKDDYITGGHALVNPSHIIEDKIVIDEKLTISNEKFEELSAYKLEKGDIVFGRRGEMGRCAVVNEVGLLCGTGSIIIRPNGKIHPLFLQKMLSSPSYRRVIENKAVGITMMNLNVPIVSSFMLPLFPRALQVKYISLVRQSDNSKRTIRQSLEKLQTLKAAMMKKYFQ